MSRRVFIGGVAGLAGSAYLGSLVGGPFGTNPFRVLAAAAGTVLPPSPTPDFVIPVEREADMLLADFKFYGFSLQHVGGTPTLVPTVTSSASTGTVAGNIIVVQLPPQCIGEAAYPVVPKHNDVQSALPLPVDPPPIVSAVAGPSRLCFTLPAGVNVPLPTMTAEDLLDWSKWTLLVPLTAQEGPPAAGVAYPTPYEPTPFETAIEFPYALFIAPVVFGSAGPSARKELSPGYGTFFTSRSKPLLNDGISDLWTATLGRTNTIAGTITHTPTPPPQVAAVWAFDYFPWQEKPPTPPNATPADVIFYQPVPPK
jgi:hypothetical protein